MSVLKKLLALPIGIILVGIFYQFVSIPIVPCIAVYISAHLLADAHKITRWIILLCTSLFGIYLFGFQTLSAIKFYPQYGNIIAIVFDVATIISFIGAFITNIKATKQLTH